MKNETVSMKTLLLFFIPLGFSASLVTLSHLIINSTLARGAHSEVIIATYAIAMSLHTITERLAVILRQTCSTMVRDRESFQKMKLFSYYTIGIIVAFTTVIAFTPIGDFIFLKIFGANKDIVPQVKATYQIAMYVTIFSGLRCLYHGIIIYNRQTKWLTIGMLIRLAVMYVVSLMFINTGTITAKTGAYIFLIGMMVEFVMSFIEARSLVKKMPEKSSEQINSKSQIFRFYSPLMLSSIVTVLIGPVINIYLGKTDNIELAIASYTIAFSITQLAISYLSYTHQIVINFYKGHESMVKRFTLFISFLPVVVLSIICYTSAGTFFLERMMGVSGRLFDATLEALQIFMILAIVFPFVDYLNGLLMLQRQTKVTIFSQSTNLVITFIILFIGVKVSVSWNGVIGAFAQSIGLLAELLVLTAILNYSKIRGKVGKLLRLSRAH
ncbi:multi antimicrobial extrusion protein MatE [Fredinandcohnia sp. 179-A 10B2 NHS]|uniref:multi antimicrobial extrusion protein MatE n=1 Tax=Fredinandcohnia sp. 179-A 10B2 NHS TaxID=3235176 RepID=UPI0039A2A426